MLSKLLRNQRSVACLLGIVLSSFINLPVWSANAEGLVVHLPLDGNGIGLVNGVDGEIFGAMSATGQVGGALTFDGNDLVRLNDTSSLPSGNTPVTVSIWSKSEGHISGGDNIRTLFSYGSEQNFMDITVFFVNQFATLFYVGSAGTRDQATPSVGNAFYAPNEWHHLVVSYDGSEVVMYLDGQERHRSARDWSFEPVLAGIGHRPSILRADASTPWQGEIDDLRVYNRALGASEALDLYNQGVAAASTTPAAFVEPVAEALPAPVAYYNFDNGSVADVTGNGFDGIDVGSTFAPNGQVNGARRFSADTYVEITNAEGLPSGNAARTVALWAQPDELAGVNYLISYGQDDVQAGQRGFYIDEGDLTSAPGSGVFTGTQPGTDETQRLRQLEEVFFAGEWTHIAVSYDGVVGKLYVNGQLIGYGDRDWSFAPGPGSIGRRHLGFDNQSWLGLIDEVRIYDVELDPRQVALLYNNELSGEGAPVETPPEEDTPVIEPVRFVGQSDIAVELGESINVQLGVSNPSDTAIDFAVVAGPADLVLDRATGEVSWTPSEVGVETISIRVTALADVSNSDTVSFSVTTVAPAALPISFVGQSDLTLEVGESLALNLGLNNPSNAVVIYALESGPEGLALDADTGALRWVPESAGSETVRVRASVVGEPDNTDLLSFTILVEAPEVVVPPPAPTPGANAEGLVVHLPLDGNGIGLVNGVDGEIFGAAAAEGQVGGALSFDGSSLVRLSDVSSLPSGNSPLTISIWSKTEGHIPGGENTRTLFSYGSEQNFMDISVLFPHQFSTVFFIGAAGTGNQAAPAVGNSIYTPNDWHHMLVSYDGSEVVMYFDGQEIHRSARDWSFEPVLAGIGHRPSVVNAAPSTPWQGEIDDLRVYNRVLDASEALALYNQGVAATSTTPAAFVEPAAEALPAPVAYYNFDNGSVADVSGNGFDGIDVGSTFDPNGQVNGARRFSADTYVEITNAEGLPSGNAARTVALWAQPDELAGVNYLISYGQDDVQAGQRGFYIDEGDLTSAPGSGVFTGTQPGTNETQRLRQLEEVFFAGEWTHIAVSYDGVVGKLYVNGQLVGYGDRDWSFAPGPGSIGRRHLGFGNQSWLGLIDEVRIYDVELDPRQVALLYNNELSGEGTPVETPPEEETPVIERVRFVGQSDIAVELGESINVQLGVSNPSDTAIDFAVVAGPADLVLDRATGEVSWTPSEVGVETISIRVTALADVSNSDTVSFSVTTVAPAALPISFVGQSDLTLEVGESLALNLGLNNPSNAAVIYALESGPEGLALDADTGALRWVPEAAGSETVRVRASVVGEPDNTDLLSFTILVEAPAPEPIAFASQPDLSIELGESVSLTLTLDNPSDTPVLFRVLQGPVDLALDANTGRIEWTPSTAGSQVIQIQALAIADSDNNDSVRFTVQVNEPAPEPLVLLPQADLDLTLGESVDLTLALENPSATAVLFELNAGPSDLFLDATSGEIQWTPSVVGSELITVSVIAIADSANRSQVSFTVTTSEVASGLDAGLIAHWTLDNEGEDAQGRFPGTRFGASQVEGQVASALSFDGNDFIQLDNVRNLPTVGYSMAIWAKHGPEFDGNETLLSYGQGNDYVRITLAPNPYGFGRPSIAVGGPSALSVANLVEPDRWYHIAFSYDGSEAVLYIDGQEVRRNNVAWPVDPQWGYIGRRDNQYWKGDLDDARIYDRVLSDAEVTQLYQQGLVAASVVPTAEPFAAAELPAPLAYYSFDTGDAVDESGNGFDGTNLGAVPIAEGRFGAAMRFANEAYIELAQGDQFPSGRAPRTLMAWTRLENVNSFGNFAISYGQSNIYGAGQYTQISAAFSGAFVGVSSSSRIVRYRVYSPQEWTHVALTYDGEIGRIFIDGQEVTLIEGDWTTQPGSAAIGRLINTNNYWKGDLDEVRVYDQALNPEQIDRLYRNDTQD